MSQPNILLIVLDEFRAPPVYESKQLKRFRNSELASFKHFKEHGITFRNHYTGSSACVPSRGVLYTGQYPSLTKVKSTTGLAKDDADPAMKWLEHDGIPTMGHWFKNAGYETKYVGKWHISYEDLLDDEDNIIFPFSTSRSKVDKKALNKYLKADVLAKYGFDCGWVGPEPHGANEDNCGWFKDPIYVQETKTFLEEKEKEYEELDSDANPWIMTVNLVNPHDIVFANQLGWYLKTFRHDRPNDWGGEGDTNFKKFKKVPRCPPSPTDKEDLSETEKPKAQQKFSELYYKILGSPIDKLVISDEDYRRFYYWLLALADRNVEKIIQALENQQHLRENTIVVVTSDHGEMLGAHGGQRQKWFNVYEESMHIPLMMHIPQKMTVGVDLAGKTIDSLTCSVDILPTLLGFAGVDVQAVAQKLNVTHREVHMLPGRDWSKDILSQNQAAKSGISINLINKLNLKEFQAEAVSTYIDSMSSFETLEAIYMETGDNITRGANQLKAVAKASSFIKQLIDTSYDAILDPYNINAAVFVIQVNGEFTLKLKYAKYWDNPEEWTHPFKKDKYRIRVNGTKDPTSSKRRNRGDWITKTEALPQEAELYDLIHDPIEMRNLAGKRRKQQDEKGLFTLAAVCNADNTFVKLKVEAELLLSFIDKELGRQEREKTRMRKTEYHFEYPSAEAHGQFAVPKGFVLLYTSILAVFSALLLTVMLYITRRLLIINIR